MTLPFVNQFLTEILHENQLILKENEVCVCLKFIKIRFSLVSGLKLFHNNEVLFEVGARASEICEMKSESKTKTKQNLFFFVFILYIFVNSTTHLI